jgi:maleylacetate reductase
MLSGVYRFPQMESVVFGKPFSEALAQEVDRLDARAVFVMASGTLSRETDLVGRLRQTLGNRFAGLCAKIGAHTPRNDVVAAANSARDSGADLIVTLAAARLPMRQRWSVCVSATMSRAPSNSTATAPASPPTGRPSAPRSTRLPSA